MEENESLDEFYAKLKNIVNSAFNLGKTIPEPKIVRKVLRSLPKRFYAKITAIEESKDIGKIPLTKLVGNLQTYEIGLSRIGKSGKGKSMALKAKSNDTDDSLDDEDSKMKSYITRQFKKASSAMVQETRYSLLSDSVSLRGYQQYNNQLVKGKEQLITKKIDVLKQRCYNSLCAIHDLRIDFQVDSNSCLFLISFPTPTWIEELKASYHGDAEVQQILQSIAGSSEASGSPLGGHSGYLKTFHRAKRDWFRWGMKQDLKDYIKCCDICQRIKHETSRPAGLLQPLAIPHTPWTSISMDFVEGLPKSQKQEVVLVVVDRLTKFVHFIPLSYPYTTAKVASLFMQHIFKLHGMPTSIVSDRDPIFTSKFWEELFRLQGVELAMSSAYHPQSDGQTEVVNKSLEQFLRAFAGDKPKQWVEWLPLAEFWFNTNYHTATKLTPFEALYGFPPPTLLDYIPGLTKAIVVEEYLQNR
ncbi:uncharacterized protein LOC136070305 [Quercus suber]|uniref:uncharacterized protein LOC136070305 n=1 Tax=Quercus suber TaxID=58331 RepID=UPI0032DE8D3D